jgi:hypothetical protein
MHTGRSVTVGERSECVLAMNSNFRDLKTLVDFYFPAAQTLLGAICQFTGGQQQDMGEFLLSLLTALIRAHEVTSEVTVCARVCKCAHACVCACLHVCVRMCVCVWEG